MHMANLQLLPSGIDAPEVEFAMGADTPGWLMWQRARSVLRHEGSKGAEHLPLCRRQLDIANLHVIIVMPVRANKLAH